MSPLPVQERNKCHLRVVQNNAKCLENKSKMSKKNDNL